MQNIFQANSSHHLLDWDGQTDKEALWKQGEKAGRGEEGKGDKERQRTDSERGKHRHHGFSYFSKLFSETRLIRFSTEVLTLVLCWLFEGCKGWSFSGLCALSTGPGPGVQG